jgi:Dolichyl-phosphate-mannose-protein mannosyltransferase
LLAVGATKVKEWTVMTDELLYAKLAGHIADTGSPLPVLHGEHVGFLGIVYPILLAPFYAVLDPVAAFDAGHALNAVLFASTAIPVFLLGRRVVPRECALVVALLSLVVPWAVNTATLMSESAAYPAFAWAVLACHAALVEPSARRDAVAIGALAVAFFTRPQFLVLVAVLPLAAVVVDGPRRALARHRVLAGAGVLAILVVVPLAALGEAHRLLGDYGVTATEGSILPSGVWKAAAIHLDVLAIGLGVLPFLLGVAWIYSSLRAAVPAARAVAAFAAVALPLLALETASYDLRFGGEGVNRTRYLFYLAPLLLLATAAALGAGRPPIRGVVGATAFFAATVSFAGLPRVGGVALDSAEAVLFGVIRDLSPGLPPGVFVALCGVALGILCLAFVRLPAPGVMLGVTAVLFAYCGSATGYAFDRLLSSKAASGLPVTGQKRVRDWIDRAAEGRTVALVAYPVSRDWGYSAVSWWDAEFWNKTITRAYVARDGHWTYTPFPATELRVDPNTGLVAGTKKAPKLALMAFSDSRFGLVGDQRAANLGLTLLKLQRPWRAAWTTVGLAPDGWIRPSRRASIRVFAVKDEPTQEVKVAVTLDSPPEAQRVVTYMVGNATGTLAPTIRAVAEATVCVPAGGHADLPVRSQPAATINGPPFGPKPEPRREVGLIVSGVQLSSTGNPCTP